MAGRVPRRPAASKTHQLVTDHLTWSPRRPIRLPRPRVRWPPPFDHAKPIAVRPRSLTIPYHASETMDSGRSPQPANGVRAYRVWPIQRLFHHAPAAGAAAATISLGTAIWTKVSW